MENASFERHEARASLCQSELRPSASYAFINSDGTEFIDREQASVYAGVNLSDYWSVNASSSYDLETKELLSIGGGLHYLDECFELTFTSTYTPAGETEETEGDFAFLFAVNFKNLGGVDMPF